MATAANKVAIVDSGCAPVSPQQIAYSEGLCGVKLPTPQAPKP